MAILRQLSSKDWSRVHSIYLEGIATGQATFQTDGVSWEEWDAAHLQACRLVITSEEQEGSVLGWAALSSVSKRTVYCGVAEVSIYVAAAARGQGHGRRLLDALVECSEQAGIWTLQAGIFPENRVSVELHRRCGFRVVGTRERVGVLRGVWRDVLLMERRSSITGVD